MNKSLLILLMLPLFSFGQLFLKSSPKYTYTVGRGGNFETLAEAINWLGTGTNMTNTCVLLFDGTTHLVSTTVTINLSHSLVIRGISEDGTSISASTGLVNLSMIVVNSPVCFDRITLNGSTLASWGDNAGENLVNITATSGKLIEFIHCTLNTSNKAIYITGVPHVDLNNCIIKNFKVKGIELNTASSGFEAHFNHSEFNGITTAIGLDLAKGLLVNISSIGCGFSNGVGGIAVKYDDSQITYTDLNFLSCSHNHVGAFFSGFDFTLARNADIEIKGCIGEEDKTPHAKINVIDNTSTTTITTALTYYKAAFTNTSSYSTKFTIANNRMTFQPTHTADIKMFISANVANTSANRNGNICIVKNGNGIAMAPMTFRNIDANTYTAVSLNVYLDDVVFGDYFEIWVTTLTNNGSTLTVSDVAWLVN